MPEKIQNRTVVRITQKKKKSGLSNQNKVIKAKSVRDRQDQLAVKLLMFLSGSHVPGVLLLLLHLSRLRHVTAAKHQKLLLSSRFRDIY